MFACVFIDWENIEKTVKQEYGSVLDYTKFIETLRNVSTSNKVKLVGIHAYGDFDKGNAGLMSKLVNLGVDPHHVVTKTAQEYIKGSTDIELSLDILDTMYSYPHITDFVFVSGDGDLRHVMKRLKQHGKTLKLVGFERNTNHFLIDLVDEFITLEQYKETIMRQITMAEKEQLAISLLSNKYVRLVIEELARLEEGSTMKFIGLNYFRRRLTDYYSKDSTEISDALTDCLDSTIIKDYSVENPKDINHPTTACKLNRTNIAVKHVLKRLQ